jgi:hypothetical protein
MTHEIIRGQNGRRHEVDFGDAPIRVEVYASEETVEIFVEADSETLAEERRRFAIINIPLHFSAKLRAKRHPAQQRKIANVLAFRSGLRSEFKSAVIFCDQSNKAAHRWASDGTNHRGSAAHIAALSATAILGMSKYDRALPIISG